MGAAGGAMDHSKGMMMAPAPSSSSSMPMPMKKKMMMHMTFFWGHRVDILFSGWPGDRGLSNYLLALLLVFVLSFLMEFLSFIPPRLSGSSSSSRRRKLSSSLLLTCLTALRTGMSYLVMLAVMSFNVGVLLIAVAGHAFGFFVFGSGVFFGRSGGQQGIGNKC